MRLWPFRRRRRAVPSNPNEPRFRNPYFAAPSPEKNRQKIVLELTSLGCILFALVIITTFSPIVFGVTTIDVRGNQRLPSERIQQNVRESLNTTHLGFFPRSNMITASTMAVTRDLRSAFALETVNVQRRWPHTLVITVKESYPAFALKINDQTAVLMTRQGSVAEILTDLSQLESYPVLISPKVISVETNDFVLLPTLSNDVPELSGKLRSLGFSFTELRLQLTDCLTPTPKTEELGTNTNTSESLNTNIAGENDTAININTNSSTEPEQEPCSVLDQIKRAEDISVHLEAGYNLLLSTAEDLDRQLEKYQAFKTNEPDTVVREYVDLRVPGRIYYK